MKIAIPTLDGKLCAHFGHCETFSFVEINPETKEIMEIYSGVPEEGISCQCAGWIAEQGTEIVLAGGMGGRPMMMFEQLGIQVISGCPELPIQDIVKQFLDNSLVIGENSCNHGEDHVCHGHGDGHHCGHHH